MATFTTIRNKKQTAGAMLGVLSYVAQGKKTMLDGACLVTGSNCVPQASYLEMMTTKQRFQKTNGRQFYHFVQSFSETDDLTPQEVNAIGLELAQRAFPGYEVVIATHVDTNHLHNHLVVNSVSCENGRKLHQNRDSKTGKQLFTGSLHGLRPHWQAPGRTAENGEAAGRADAKTEKKMAERAGGSLRAGVQGHTAGDRSDHHTGAVHSTLAPGYRPEQTGKIHAGP